MISNICESPVFSPPQPPPQFVVETQASGGRRIVPVRKRTRALVREIVFPANNLYYPLTTFYKFPERKQAIFWDSIKLKQERNPTTQSAFTNAYNSGVSDFTNSPLTVRAKSVVLVHPPLTLSSLGTHNIYVPTADQRLKFTVVVVRRKGTEIANIQVQVLPDATNPYLTSSILQQELSKNARCKASVTNLRKRQTKDKSLVQQPTRFQAIDPGPDPAPQHLAHGSSFKQPLPYCIQDVKETGQIQLNKVPQQSGSPPQRLPATQFQPKTSPSSFQKGKVALCLNCGVHSINLLTCTRCTKSNMGPILDDVTSTTPSVTSTLQESSTTKNNNNDENETKSEVVDLSSDENEDSQEAISPKDCKIDSSHLLSYPLLWQSASQNGKESSIDRTTPEEVIEILSDLTCESNVCSMFTLVTCSYIRIGTYLVIASSETGFSIRTTIGEAGLFFELPAYNTGVTKKIGIPKNQILTLYGHSDPHIFYIKISTGPKLAKWIRTVLNMDMDSNNGECYFCPMHGDPSRQEFFIMFSEADEQKAAVLRRLYKDIYKPCKEHETNGSAGCPKNIGRKGVLVKVDWRGHGYTSQEKLDHKDSAAEFQPPRPLVIKSEKFIIDESRKLFHYPVIPVESDSNFYTDSSITVTAGDIACLGDLQYLNDQVMDFWMRHIVDQLSPEEKEKAYVFNTFFYKRLTTKPSIKRKSVNTYEYDNNLTCAEKRHCRVKNWTKKVDIFEKDFLFIPINENSHWFLVVLCFPGLVPLVTQRPNSKRASNKKPQNMIPEPMSTDDGDRNGPDVVMTHADENSENAKESCEENMDSSDNVENTETSSFASNPVQQDLPKSTSHKAHIKRPCIIIFDSLGPENRARLFTTLREYLQIEHNTRKGAGTKIFDRYTVAGIMPSVPFQPNGWDCGFYVLCYTEAFFRSPFTNFTSGRTIRIKNWFKDEEVASKRQEIYDFIVEYVKRYFPDNSQCIPERPTMESSGDMTLPIT